MLFRITLANGRGNYVYRSDDGSVSIIAGSQESEILIKSRYAFDNMEVYNNIKTAGDKSRNGRRK